jgi:hypothetical protein
VIYLDTKNTLYSFEESYFMSKMRILHLGFFLSKARIFITRKKLSHRTRKFNNRTIDFLLFPRAIYETKPPSLNSKNFARQSKDCDFARSEEMKKISLEI